MSKNLDEEIVSIYDDILSGLDHISSLNIKIETVKKLLEYSSTKEFIKDPDIDLAHKRFIGEVVLSSQNALILNAKRYILYPDFKVSTYMPNKEYFYKDNSSLEKSLIIGKRGEINFILNDPNFRPKNNEREIMVLNIERVEFSFDMDYYKITYKSIPSSLFYDFYARLIIPYKKYRQITDNDYIHFKSMAVRDCLNVLGDTSDVLDGEFTLKRSDYPKLKDYLKSKYNIEYQDDFESVTNEVINIWNNLGVVRYDNRALMNFHGAMEPYPLVYQRRNQKNRL